MSTLNTITSSSVAIDQDQVYASQRADKQKIISIYKYNDIWTKIHSFKVADMDSYGTLIVKNNQIKSCIWEEHQISVFSTSGQLLQICGSHSIGEASKLNYPTLCQEDEFNAILFADFGNDALKILKNVEQFSLMSLHPQVKFPMGAAIFRSKLYVSSRSKNKLYLYV